MSASDDFLSSSYLSLILQNQLFCKSDADKTIGTRSQEINHSSYRLSNLVNKVFRSTLGEDPMIVDAYASSNNDLTRMRAVINKKLFEIASLTPHLMQRKQILMERHCTVFGQKAGSNNFTWILLAKNFESFFIETPPVPVNISKKISLEIDNLLDHDID